MLERLAEEEGMTAIQYLIRIVRRRALGHLKDLGDDRGNFRLYEEGPSNLKVDSFDLRG